MWGYWYAFDADGRVTQKTGPIDSSGSPASTVSYVSGPAAGGASDTVFKSAVVKGAAYNYFYDALGRRRLKSYPGGTSDEYFYDLGHQLLVDQGNASNAPSSTKMLDEYIWLGGRPVAIVRSNLTSAWVHQADNAGTCQRTTTSDSVTCGIFFPVTDVIGKTALMLNSAGHVAGSGEYDPFGHVNRVFIDAESLHPYLSTQGVFSDFTQAVPSGFAIDMRVFVDLLDTDPPTVGGSCDGGNITGSAVVDKLEVRNRSDVVLTSFAGYYHQGLFVSGWLHPIDGRLRLAMTGGGHCTAVPCSCPPRQVCYCDPGMCSWSCDSHTQKTQPGAVVGYYEYRRYETGQQPFWTPLRFPGQYFDAETDLFENWNRYYEPLLARYSEVEPREDPKYLLLQALSGRPVLSYGYANDGPIRYDDPTGLSPSQESEAKSCEDVDAY